VAQDSPLSGFVRVAQDSSLQQKEIRILSLLWLRIALNLKILRRQKKKKVKLLVCMVKGVSTRRAETKRNLG
jgi:hypothetical protein